MGAYLKQTSRWAGDVEALIGDVAIEPLGGGAAGVEPIGGGSGDPVEEPVGKGTPALISLVQEGRREKGFLRF